MQHKMRDVLYRAKPINLDAYKGEDKEKFKWVCGCPVVNPLPKELSLQIFEPYNGQMRNWECDPDTLCQCTLIPDKKGKLVFEGDILRVTRIIDGEFIVSNPRPSKYKCVVRWSYCGWIWDEIAPERVRHYLDFPEAWVKHDFVVVGNIFDNPEMLGGKCSDWYTSLNLEQNT